jgi:hypothetical protein
MADIEDTPTFCWEFHKNKRFDYLKLDTRCEDYFVYKARYINCCVLRAEGGHKKSLVGIPTTSVPTFIFIKGKYLPTSE